MKADRVILGGLVITLLPFLLLAAFNHPTDDDFCTYQLFNNRSPWEAFQYGYSSFSGRYAYLLLFAHWDPLYAENWLTWTRIWPLVTLVAFFLVIRAVVSHLFVISSRREHWLITAALTMMLLVNWPSIASSFYWFTGATVYTLALCCAVISLVSLNNSIQSPGTRSFGMMLLAALFALVAVGSNEVLISFLLVSCALAVFIHLVRKEAIPGALWIFLAVVLAGSIVALTAPGNFKRAGEMLHRSADALYAVRVSAKSLYLVGLKMGSWLASLPLWLGTLLIAAWAEHTRFTLVQPRSLKEAAWTFVLLLLGMAGIAFLSAYAYNDVIPRVFNLIYFVFTIGFIFFIVSALKSFPAFSPILGFMKTYTLHSSILFVLICLLSTQSNITIAWNDLAFKAREYDQRLLERYEILRQAKLNNQARVQVEPLFTESYRYPRSLFLNDLRPEADQFPNTCESFFFGVESIELNGRPENSRHLAN